jgi:hypothetical protein
METNCAAGRSVLEPVIGVSSDALTAALDAGSPPRRDGSSPDQRTPAGNSSRETRNARVPHRRNSLTSK